MKRLLSSFTLSVCLAAGSLGLTNLANAEGASWKGFYTGASLGRSIVDLGFDNLSTSRDEECPTHACRSLSAYNLVNLDDNANGYAGSAHIGYNIQKGSFVFGIEGDFSKTTSDIEAAFRGYPSTATTALTTASLTDDYSPSTSYKVELDSLASIRARAGIAKDNYLLFLTGGVAFANIDVDIENGGYKGAYNINREENLTGYVIGGGGEYMFANGFSLRGEVLHYGFDDKGFDFDATVVRTGLSIQLN